MLNSFLDPTNISWRCRMPAYLITFWAITNWSIPVAKKQMAVFTSCNEQTSDNLRIRYRRAHSFSGSFPAFTRESSSHARSRFLRKQQHDRAMTSENYVISDLYQDIFEIVNIVSILSSQIFIKSGKAFHMRLWSHICLSVIVTGVKSHRCVFFNWYVGIQHSQKQF